MPTFEERVCELELMLKHHIATTTNIQRDVSSLSDLGAKSFFALNMQLNRLEATVAGHTSTLNSHTATLNSHTATLNSHTATLNAHTAMHNEHKADLASLKDDVAQILQIVSGQHLKKGES